jgi:hypothetical protein
MTGVAHALKVLELQAYDDDAVAETLLFLANEAEGPADPFAGPTDGVLSAARQVNTRRARERHDQAETLDTAAVVALVTSITDRKGVDRRRQRGQLLAWRSGARTLHPSWQFDRRRGDTWPGLADVLTALRDVTTDAQAADAVMTTPRDDLDGRTLAQVLAAGRVQTVIRLIHAAGEQS